MEFSDTLQAEVAELAADLAREDQMGMVVRAHIRVESLLIQTIDCLVLRPNLLPKLNLDYDQYVTLALALGLKEKFGPPLHVLGKLRNDFAHKLNTSLTKQSANNLYTAFGADDKREVQACFERIKGDNEEMRHFRRFSDLEPADQFKILALTLWAVVRATVMLHAEAPGNAQKFTQAEPASRVGPNNGENI
ncbi:hypothetical protein ABFU84_05815 [Xanthomonas translucens pv. undulosa]|uniref:hypothetical protein n=1 Tax=Xanthomonas campestris pv. translucens TaxID=343 RepID=UPI003CFB9188